MSRSRRNILIAGAAGLVSELWPIPGALLAAVIFSEGIHSSEPTIYIAVTFVINFLFVARLVYGLLATFPRKGNRHSSPRVPSDPKPTN